jgi:ATP-dependent DNA ligase
MARSDEAAPRGRAGLSRLARQESATSGSAPAEGLTALPVPPGTLPMEARSVDALPEGPGWQYEPKWDGFRCLAFRAGEAVALQAKSGKDLTRYFPEVAALMASLASQRFVVDGELAVPIGDSLSFDALQLRLHPAESRIRRLAAETPAIFIAFDLLLAPDGDSLQVQPLAERRLMLEDFHAHASKKVRQLRLSPYTRERAEAQAWLERAGGMLDGVVAKRLDGRYEPGERSMLKVKCLRTADCVVGGFRYGRNSREVASLLLGLYDDDGKLHHVGFTTMLGADREKLTRRLEAMVEPPGFTGNAPGGPSRWATERSSEWQPLRPELVVEVRYDHVTGNRFRHGTALLRWRPDKAPKQCRFDQLEREARPAKLIADVLEA